MLTTKVELRIPRASLTYVACHFSRAVYGIRNMYQLQAQACTVTPLSLYTALKYRTLIQKVIVKLNHQY